MRGQKLLQQALSLLLIGVFLAGCTPPMQGRFRVTLTGFVVHHGTTESILSIDGAGDEVFALANIAELWSSNNIVGTPQRRKSLLYGDTSGHRVQVGVGVTYPRPPEVIHAGTASPTGGLRADDHYPRAGEEPERLPRESEAIRNRLIPMILWEGWLRQGGPRPNAVVILPTIWEDDNVHDVLDVWQRQAEAWIRRFATNSALFIIDPTRRPLIERGDTVLSTIPQGNDFDRPIGIDGAPFVPIPADLEPATFIPAVMFLTFRSAQEAASRGVVEIRYIDGERYGPGDYSIFLLVERLPDR